MPRFAITARAVGRSADGVRGRVGRQGLGGYRRTRATHSQCEQETAAVQFGGAFGGTDLRAWRGPKVSDFRAHEGLRVKTLATLCSPFYSMASESRSSARKLFV